jgi:hypothetical protein
MHGSCAFFCGLDEIFQNPDKPLSGMIFDELLIPVRPKLVLRLPTANQQQIPLANFFLPLI